MFCVQPLFSHITISTYQFPHVIWSYIHMLYLFFHIISRSHIMLYPHVISLLYVCVISACFINGISTCYIMIYLYILSICYNNMLYRHVISVCYIMLTKKSQTQSLPMALAVRKFNIINIFKTWYHTQLTSISMLGFEPEPS